MPTKTKPTELILHRDSHTLEVAFDNGERFNLPWEYLRVFCPSKKVRARFGKERILVLGKEDVVLERIEPIGHYAVKLHFDDGHHAGIYDWGYLHELGVRQAENWREHQEGVARLKREEQ